MNYNTFNIPDYTIIRKIGEGGMGAVFLAVDNLLQRQVAIKLLKSELAPGEESVLRFQSEAVMLAKLRHPNITMLYNLLQTNGCQYMIMEYVEGETFESLLKSQGVFSVKQVMDIAVPTLEGLQHAHSKGVIHRDLKPSNLMLSTEGEVKIMDFGIARIAGGSRLTRIGQAIGTPQYMSPEQIKGQEGDRASDIYSIGIVFYELLTGTTPFESNSEFEIMQAQTGSKPIPPASRNPDIPEALNKAILKALEKEPSKRFSSADEFKQCLLQINREIAAELSTQKPPLFHWKLPDIATKWKLPKIPVAWKIPVKINRQYLVGTVFLVISLLAAFFLLFRSPEPQKPDSPSVALNPEQKNLKIEVEPDVDMGTIMRGQSGINSTDKATDIPSGASPVKKDTVPNLSKNGNPPAQTPSNDPSKTNAVKKPLKDTAKGESKTAPASKTEILKLGKEVVIGRGTKVKATLDNSYEYDSAEDGERVTLSVSEPLERSGMTIIPVGLKAYAILHKNPRKRELELEMLEIESITRQRLKSLNNTYKAAAFRQGSQFKIALEYDRME